MLKQTESKVKDKDLTPLGRLVFETDMGDPRFYAEAQIKTRIEAYLETLETRDSLDLPHVP